MKIYSKVLKGKAKPLFHILLLVTALFGFVHQASAQEKVNATVGIGAPELLNAGVRFQSNQTQLGLSIGSMPLSSGENIISISSDVYYHFGGFSELSPRRPWYLRIGMSYVRDETRFEIDKFLILSTRFGREFNVSKHIGIEVDLGAMFELFHEETRKRSSSSFIDLDSESSIAPSIGVGLFYRFL